MTANTSAVIIMGIKIPVDFLASKTKAIKVTIMAPSPLIPDFPIPNNKVAVKAKPKSNKEI